jgi:hypothetical protein
MAPYCLHNEHFKWEHKKSGLLKTQYFLKNKPSTRLSVDILDDYIDCPHSLMFVETTCLSHNSQLL